MECGPENALSYARVMQGATHGTKSGLARAAEHLMQRYAADSTGRLVENRDGGVPPRFVLARAAEGCIWRFRAGLDDDVVRRIAKLAGRERGAVQAERGPPERLAAIAAVLGPPGEPVEFRYEAIGDDASSVAEIWIFP